MPKLTLANLANLTGNEQSATNTINNNSDLTETAIENTLSRDGTSPNSMGADLDMNGFDIINAANIFFDGDLIEADVVADYVDFNETSEPASPSSNTARFFARDVSTNTRLAYKTSDGTVVPVGIAATDSLTLTNIAQTGYHDLSEISVPSSPSSNAARLYAYDSNGTTELAYKDSTGRITTLSDLGVIDVRDYGAVGDDTTDDAAAIQAALDAANGGTVRLVPGLTYRVATAIVTRGKSWTLDARGAKIHVDADVPCLTAYADIDNLQAVSSVSGDEVTVANGSAFSVGDHVRVISEDVPTNARDVSAGDEYKTGEPGIVASIAGNVLTLKHGLFHSSEMVTSPRIFRMPLEEQVEIIGGEWYYTEGHDATPWNSPMLSLYGLINPRVIGIRITRGYSEGLILTGTQHAFVKGLRIERLTDNISNSQFGYGLMDAGYDTTCIGISGEGCRHLVTTNPVTVPTSTTSEDELHKYGHSRGLRVLGGTCMGASSTAFDTHHQTEAVFFSGLYAQNCPGAVGIRAQGAQVIGVEGHNIDGPMINIFSDNTDTPATEAGWAADVYVDQVFGDSNYLLRAARATNIHLGFIKARCTEWQMFQCVDAQVFMHDNMLLIVNDTDVTHAGRGVFDSDDAIASGFTPVIEQKDGRIRVQGSGSSGSATFAAVRSDASDVILRDTEIIFPTGSTGPMLITANSGTITADIKFDIASEAETGMTLTSGSNISANIESADGLNDQLNLRRKAREPLKWIATGTPETATIASGVITASASFMTIDTESAAATDDLDTINEGVNGDILILRTTASARDIVVKNGTGNITCGYDRTLSSLTDRIVLMNTNGTAWVMVGIFSSSGSGGAVTQATNKSTGVTLNSLSGQITMNNATLNAGASVAFAFTNSRIAAADNVVINVADASATNDAYRVEAHDIASGSCRVRVTNVSGGNLGEAIVLNFSVIKQAFIT